MNPMRHNVETSDAFLDAYLQQHQERNSGSLVGAMEQIAGTLVGSPLLRETFNGKELELGYPGHGLTATELSSVLHNRVGILKKQEYEQIERGLHRPVMREYEAVGQLSIPEELALLDAAERMSQTKLPSFWQERRQELTTILKAKLARNPMQASTGVGVRESRSLLSPKMLVSENGRISVRDSIHIAIAFLLAACGVKAIAPQPTPEDHLPEPISSSLPEESLPENGGPVEVIPEEEPVTIPESSPTAPIPEVPSLPAIPPGLPEDIQQAWGPDWSLSIENGIQVIYNPDGQATLTSPDGVNWTRVEVQGENSLTYMKVEGGQLVEDSVALETMEYNGQEIPILPDEYAAVGWALREGEWTDKDQRTYIEGEWIFSGSLGNDLEQFGVDFMADVNARSGYNIKGYPPFSQKYFGVYMKYDWNGGTLLAVRNVSTDGSVVYKFAFTPATGAELGDVALPDSNPVMNQYLFALAAQH